MARMSFGLVAAASAAAFSFGGSAAGQGNLTGAVRIDGSSTVYPITEAVAEEFADVAPRVRVTVGISGTGGGFKRFVLGETDVSDASRPIKPKEAEAAAANGIEYIEIPVAYDGLSIVVNNENYWVDSLTVDELKKIYLERGAAKLWSDVRPEWPSTPIRVYAPGTDSGTFDYFKEVVASGGESIRADMSVSEDDNVLVTGVAGDPSAIGFFGCAYYFENKSRLKVVPIHNGKEPVTPIAETIESGEYAPFSRPLFIYVNKKSADRPEVRAFIQFYLNNAARLSDEVGYVRLPQSVYEIAKRKFQNREIGTVYLKDGKEVHGAVTKVYQ